MITNPILPIWLMAVICVFMLIIRRRTIVGTIRQFLIVALVFVINLRILVPGGSESTKTQTMDLYVVFVVDDTISMVAQDYHDGSPRLDAVKNDCKKIIQNLYGAKFAVISFHNDGNQLCPFTDDADYAISIIDSITPLSTYYARGTSINVCQGVMRGTLERAKKREDGPVVVFFISDGEMTGEEHLASFKDMAKLVDAGAVLGYGSAAGGKMYVRDWDDEYVVLQDTSTYPSRDAISRIDEQNLKQIALDLEIPYMNMNDGASLDGIIRDISKNATVSTEVGVGKGYRETYPFFVIPLMVLLVWEVFENRRKG